MKGLDPSAPEFSTLTDPDVLIVVIREAAASEYDLVPSDAAWSSRALLGSFFSEEVEVAPSFVSRFVQRCRGADAQEAGGRSLHLRACGPAEGE